VTRNPDADPDEDPIVGDAEGISIGEGDVSVLRTIEA